MPRKKIYIEAGRERERESVGQEERVRLEREWKSVRSDRQTHTSNRATDRQAGRQAGRQTGRQTEVWPPHGTSVNFCAIVCVCV